MTQATFVSRRAELGGAPAGFCLAALTLLALSSAVRAQSYTAVTEPVGFTKVSVAAANGTSTTRRVLAVPYNRPSVAQGLVSAVGSNTVTVTGAAWNAGQFTGTPHFVKIRKSANAGRFFPISSHTANVLTVDTAGVNLAGLVTANDAIEIFPAQTLGTLFGTSTVPFKTGATPEQADLVRLHNGTQWVSYYHDGTSWKTPGNGTSQDATVIRPDQAVFIVTRGQTAVNLTLYGQVGVGRERSSIPGSGDALVGNRFPVQTTLQNLNLHSLPGWTAGDTASVADNVMIWNGTAWNIYYYTGANWEQVGSFNSANTAPISPTTGVFIHRKPGVTGQPIQLSTDPTFTNQ